MRHVTHMGISRICMSHVTRVMFRGWLKWRHSHSQARWAMSHNNQVMHWNVDTATAKHAKSCHTIIMLHTVYVIHSVSHITRMITWHDSAYLTVSVSTAQSPSHGTRDSLSHFTCDWAVDTDTVKHAESCHTHDHVTQMYELHHTHDRQTDRSMGW